MKRVELGIVELQQLLDAAQHSPEMRARARDAEIDFAIDAFKGRLKHLIDQSGHGGVSTVQEVIACMPVLERAERGERGESMLLSLRGAAVDRLAHIPFDPH